MAVREYNKAIEREMGITNVITIVEQPTLESFKAICNHEAGALALCHWRSRSRQSRHANRQARDLRGPGQSAGAGG